MAADRTVDGMNRQIRRLGLALVICFTVLFGQLNYIQMFGAKRLNERPDNTRPIERTFSRPRGEIRTVDGVVLARSVEQRDRIKYRREYPEGDLFGPITGYYSVVAGTTGIERQYGEDLAGNTPELSLSRLSDLFVDREDVGHVELTLSAEVQRVARVALGDRRGSVVALDPRTGAIDALWSNPTFDPGPLSTSTPRDLDVKTLLDNTPGNPLRMRAYRDIFFPGSTFKVVTAAAGAELGDVTETQPSYPQLAEFDIDFADRGLRNSGGITCGGTLFAILQVSCNTSFAQMGVDLGLDRLRQGAEAFGFNEVPPIDLPGAVASTFPTEIADNEGNGPLARAAIGQGDVSATPLQMALVTAAIANRGSLQTPHVMNRILDEEGEVVEEFPAGEWRRAVRPDVADLLRRGMVATAVDGTASGLLIPGFEVGGKTGTAQLGTDPPRSHAWIIGFAGPPGGTPEVAVAVLVEAANSDNNEQSGGRTAAPIAKAVLEAVLRTRGTGGGG